MSNSIWKTPDQKPDPADEIVFMIGDLPTVGWYFATDDEFLDPSTNNRYAPDEIDRWAIFTDLIAQADKAERLQKAVEKALDTLDYVSNEKFTTEDGDFFEEYEEMHKAIKQDIDEIKQLIKEK